MFAFHLCSRHRSAFAAGLAGALLTFPHPAPADTDASPATETAESPSEAPTETRAPFVLLNQDIAPGTLQRLSIQTTESFAGAYVQTPVAVAHGREPGETICVVAGIHGDEVNGVEVVRRLLNQVDPSTLRGTLVAVPIANLSAFRRGSRYLPDRRDLNRYFPGRAFGSAASRVAHGLFEGVFRHCESLVDLHTGSFQRSNLQQLRAHLGDPETVRLAMDFGADVVVNKLGRTGTLRRSATDIGIPAITVEAGESTRFDEAHVASALEGILRLLRKRDMLPTSAPAAPRTESVAYLKTRWVRADRGGILVSRVRLGDPVEPGQVLGAVSDPLSDATTFVGSPIAGRVIGMAVDQVVMPGFAVFHLAYDAHPLAESALPLPMIPEVSGEALLEELDLDERPE